MPTKMPKSLPVFPNVRLEQLRIAAPCSVEWDDMSGDERARFCGKCEKHVYNVVAMTRAEAEALVREKEGKLCLQLYTRADGTVLTSDCPVGVRRQRLHARLWARVSSVAVSVGLVFGLLSGRARADAAVRDGDKASTPPPDHSWTRGEPMMVQPPVEVPVKKAKPAPKPAPKKDAELKKAVDNKKVRHTAGIPSVVD